MNNFRTFSYERMLDIIDGMPIHNGYNILELPHPYKSLDRAIFVTWDERNNKIYHGDLIGWLLTLTIEENHKYTKAKGKDAIRESYGILKRTYNNKIDFRVGFSLKKSYRTTYLPENLIKKIAEFWPNRFGIKLCPIHGNMLKITNYQNRSIFGKCPKCHKGDKDYAGSCPTASELEIESYYKVCRLIKKHGERQGGTTHE